MADYNFKRITVVPSAKDFIDLILSKTQRKTPTVIHKSYAISRIRSFYMRKVKFTQQNYNERLSKIINEFPKLDDLHPFHADLCNIMYNKDHYKIALGHMNMARNVIDQIGREYTRAMKNADSLYRCKMMKKAALGRMCTMMKRQATTLKYLEDVRQHLSRLPSIDPNARTLILSGFPNVGKSSLMNKITRAEVDVQPYAFTTKSLFVGHMNYRYLPWQVIDTPGILDRPNEERNESEMLSVSALIHINACVIYVMDVSEQCNESLESQLQLFKNIEPVFESRPLFVMANKIDVVTKDELKEEQLEVFKYFEEKNIPVFWTSTFTGEGVMELREAACDKLLVDRVEKKLNAKNASRITQNKNRIHVGLPAPRDQISRPPCIPQKVLEKKAREKAIVKNDDVMEMEVAAVKTERDLEIEMDDEYRLDLQKWWDLRNPDEKQDILPEFWNGHNIADFVDAEINKKLDQLEEEEGLKEAAGFYDDDEEEETEESIEISKLAKKIRDTRALRLIESHLRRKVKKATLPGKSSRENKRPDDMVKDLGKLGVDLSEADKNSHFRSRSVTRRARKRKMTSDISDVAARSKSRARSQSKPRSESGLRDQAMVDKARKLAKIAQRPMIQAGKCGESDRHIATAKPKHLFTGKRGVGKTQWR